MGAFEFFEQHPEAGAKFDALLQDINAGEQQAVADAYPFGGVELLVDVGGGNGSMLATLLSRHPGLRGVLFDQPSVIGRGAPALEAHAGRYEAVGGDFFDAVPEGADAYLLSHVLHDWPEDGCVRILDSCRRAMRPGGRVLIVEMVIPPDDSPHPGKLSDMMMIAFNGEGMERTEAEYAELLDRAGLPHRARRADRVTGEHRRGGASAQVVLHGPGVALGRVVGILAGVAQRAALAHEVPEAVELHAHLLEAGVLVGLQAALGAAALEELVLLGDEALDVVGDGLV